MSALACGWWPPRKIACKIETLLAGGYQMINTLSEFLTCDPRWNDSSKLQWKTKEVIELTGFWERALLYFDASHQISVDWFTTVCAGVVFFFWDKQITRASTTESMFGYTKMGNMTDRYPPFVLPRRWSTAKCRPHRRHQGTMFRG
jgi:hypothetical protein